jgi:mono/diheme cytochrome c family protein
MMKPSRFLCAAFLAAATLASRAADPDASQIAKLPPAADKKDVTYDKDIKAIFEKNCFKCHGPDKQKSKLRLDSLAAAVKGGENGPDIIAGKSEKSQLVWAIGRIGDEDDAMPPKPKDGPVKALPKEQVSLIRAWIDQGAK